MCACEWKEQTRIILRLNHFSIFHLSHLLKTPPSPPPPLSTNVILLFMSSKNIIQLKSFSSSSSFISFPSHIYILTKRALLFILQKTHFSTRRKKNSPAYRIACVANSAHSQRFWQTRNRQFLCSNRPWGCTGASSRASSRDVPR